MAFSGPNRPVFTQNWPWRPHVTHPSWKGWWHHLLPGSLQVHPFSQPPPRGVFPPLTHPDGIPPAPCQTGSRLTHSQRGFCQIQTGIRLLQTRRISVWSMPDGITSGPEGFLCDADGIPSGPNTGSDGIPSDVVFRVGVLGVKGHPVRCQMPIPGYSCGVVWVTWPPRGFVGVLWSEETVPNPVYEVLRQTGSRLIRDLSAKGLLDPVPTSQTASEGGFRSKTRCRRGCSESDSEVHQTGFRLGKRGNRVKCGFFP